MIYFNVISYYISYIYRRMIVIVVKEINMKGIIFNKGLLCDRH